GWSEDAESQTVHRVRGRIGLEVTRDGRDVHRVAVPGRTPAGDVDPRGPALPLDPQGAGLAGSGVVGVGTGAVARPEAEAGVLRGIAAANRAVEEHHLVPLPRAVDLPDADLEPDPAAV